jgi:hypothetical protein
VKAKGYYFKYGRSKVANTEEVESAQENMK